LAFKYYGPYTVKEKIGKVAYRLDLPTDSKIHPIFHVSQLKPFIADFTPVYSELPVTTNIEAADAVSKAVINRHLVKKGNAMAPQVLIKWTGLPDSSATWEDYNVLHRRFLDTPAWGQAASRAGGDVIPRSAAD
jgi:hypothetical protein